MTSTNPFFAFFKTHRDMAVQKLFRSFIEKVKIYENAHSIYLPEALMIETSFSSIVTSRRSDTAFAPEILPPQLLSTLLYWSVAELDSRHEAKIGQNGTKVQRPHPSGGAKYPIETYICLDQETEQCPRGFYHYRPDIHAMELVHECDLDTIKNFKNSLSPYMWVADAPVTLLFSFILERNMPKYGAFGYKLGLIEAGHIAQNIYLVSAALDLACCALGNPDETLGHEYLSLDGYNETLFYAVVVGQKPRKK